ncbi:hypothetical protein FKW77_010451 [Venturia effusa]|uniref:Uncharacterized protein n=1 Tax=Venturia effusa TaxID=50376 RepID=A0A517L6H4_9PEZI|nr:hypothetical protein FKW77_010451 [Venturia effusa]
MPTYYPLQTKVQLRTASLADSTTPVPERQKGKHATSVTEKAENVLKTGRILKETPIAIGDDDSRLHYIGPESTPFYLMHASEEVPKPPDEETLLERAMRRGLELLELEKSGSKKLVVPSFGSLSTLSSLDHVDFSEFEPTKDSSVRDASSKISTIPSIASDQFALEIEKRRATPIKGHGLPGSAADTSAIVLDDSAPSTDQTLLRFSSAAQIADSSLIPQALGLSLTFSDQTFAQTIKKPYGLHDIKTDVFVNGELAGSTTAPARKAADARNKAAEESREPLFSGRRVHRMAERAMVLVPPEQNADGSLRVRNRSKASLAGPEERWNQVNASIMEEANKMGFNKRGERPPVGAYLASVAALPMPLAVENFQKAGGPKFGVIDVVISVGSGWKLGPTSPYIMEPTRSVNDQFKASRSEIQVSPTEDEKLWTRDRNSISADAHEEGLAKAPELADLREEDLDKSGPNSDQGRAEHAQTEFSHPAEVPHEIEDPEKSRDLGKVHSVTESEELDIPFRLARPLTPPIDDVHQSFADEPRNDGNINPPIQFSVMHSSSVGSSSPERDTPSGLPKRIRRNIGNVEMRNLFGPEFESFPLQHSSQGSMPPPRTPLSSLGSSREAKRKFDATTSPRSVKRRRGSSASIAGSPGKPFLTRGRCGRDTQWSGGYVQKADLASPNPIKLLAKTFIIRRVIIESQGDVIIDRQLTKLLGLTQKMAASEVRVPSSPVFPLPESVVFGARKLSDILTPSIKPLPALQPPTPHASSSPTRKPPKSRSASPLKKSQTSIDQSTSVSRLEQRNREQKARTQDRQLAELHESWTMPDLSKDCVVSFAEKGPWKTSGNGKGGVWRNVRSARPGSFKETDVLFGVRYVIG